jgi:hypothetical protein
MNGPGFAARDDQLPLALVVSQDGVAPDTVRAALATAGFSERVAVPESTGWDESERPDVVVLNADGMDVLETLLAAGEADRLHPTMPVLVVTPDHVPAERVMAWRRAGIWEVVPSPVDAELLSPFLRNLVRAHRPPPTLRPGEPVADLKEPYTWRPFLRVAEETLALTRRYDRPLACLAFVPEWREPGSASAPLLLATRLARTLMGRMRGGDIVGLSEHGAVLVLLPDSDPAAADRLEERLREELHAEIRSWGMVTRVQSAAVHAGGGESAAGILLAAVTRAS